MLLACSNSSDVGDEACEARNIFRLVQTSLDRGGLVGYPEAYHGRLGALATYFEDCYQCLEERCCALC